jgi:hypothetical protein
MGASAVGRPPPASLARAARARHPRRGGAGVFLTRAVAPAGPPSTTAKRGADPFAASFCIYRLFASAPR